VQVRRHLEGEDCLVTGRVRALRLDLRAELNRPSATLSNSALLDPLRSRATCENAGLHSGKRLIADKDEVGGSSPPRPTIRPVTSRNAAPPRGLSRLPIDWQSGDRSRAFEQPHSSLTNAFAGDWAHVSDARLWCTAVVQHITSQMLTRPGPKRQVPRLRKVWQFSAMTMTLAEASFEAGCGGADRFSLARAPASRRARPRCWARGTARHPAHGRCATGPAPRETHTARSPGRPSQPTPPTPRPPR
jgi:hypothetical protein